MAGAAAGGKTAPHLFIFMLESHIVSFEATMEQILTLCVGLDTTDDQYRALNDTAVAFANACGWINETINPRLTNRNSIQAVCYKEAKARFGLTANHVVRACARVAANRLTAKQKKSKPKGFKPTSFDCDSRTFRIIEKGYLVSLSTTGKRVKVPMGVSRYHAERLKGQNPTSAQVCLHKDGQFYLHVQIKSEPPKVEPTDDVIGVDFGRRDIAVTSTGKSWSSETLNRTRDRFSRVRASLQRKASQGTRTSRRRCREILKRLSGRERRFQTWMNHNVSIQIIREAIALKASIAIEDLTGIRERINTQARRKIERRRFNSWAFHQLRLFLEYKSIREGVRLLIIPPAYTSQTCHKCLSIHPVQGKSYRSGKRFKCGNCSNQCDADLNGAQMIRLWGCAVNQPRGSVGLACSILPGLPKAHTELALQCG